MATQLDPELLDEYKTRVVPALREKHGYKNIHEIPKVTKVVVNSSIGAGADSKEALEIAKSEIAMITGQRPIATLVQEEHCKLQAPERSGHRCESDSEGTDDV